VKTETIEIKYGDKTDTVTLKRMKVLDRAQYFDELRKGCAPGEAPGAVAWATLNLKLIAASVINEEGKNFLTVKSINDEWDADQIHAYQVAVNSFQKPTVEEAGKNSSATASEASS